MKDTRILVAADIVSDANLVKKLLRDEFENIFVSTAPDQAVDDFERRKPDVLIWPSTPRQKPNGTTWGSIV
jgi:CheY-like chemotaxis protein